MNEIKKKSISIIVLNWNGWKDTIECLESLYQINYYNYHIIVVDNDSTDDSLLKIKEFCEKKLIPKSAFFEYNSENKPIKLFEFTEEIKVFPYSFFSIPSNQRLITIKNHVNYGFAEGNNIGMRFALKNLNPDYLLLLNNDTIVEKNFLKELVEVASENKNAGILSPFVYWYENHSNIQFGGEKVNYLRAKSVDLWKTNKSEILVSETAAGPCMLIKKEITGKVGLLPTKCGFYLADLCFSFALRRKGYKILFVKKSKIWHKGSASINKVKLKTLKNQTKEGIIFKNEFYSKKKFIFWFIFNFVSYYPYACIKSFWDYKNFKGIKAVINGICEGISFIIHSNY